MSPDTKPDVANNTCHLIFLGTGPAWRTPELGCKCAVCNRMRELGERRTRTSLWLDGPVKILIDCGPDVANQLEANQLGLPTAIFITHEHGDHYLGLDELEAFRRSKPSGQFTPIPCYAHPETWKTMEVRFGYLLGKLLEKRLALPGQALSGLEGTGLVITPFKTDHGPMPKGSMGLVCQIPGQGRMKKLVYTSDFINLPENPPQLAQADLLVAQAHWFNEPENNVPHHMSLQRLIGFIKAWAPKERVYLVHISDSDVINGDNYDCLKKRPALDPLRDPASGEPFTVPLCQEEWQASAEAVFKAFKIDVPVVAARDGLRIEI